MTKMKQPRRVMFRKDQFYVREALNEWNTRRENGGEALSFALEVRRDRVFERRYCCIVGIIGVTHSITNYCGCLMKKLRNNLMDQ